MNEREDWLQYFFYFTQFATQNKHKTDNIENTRTQRLPFEAAASATLNSLTRTQ